MSHHSNDHDSHQEAGHALSFTEKGGKLLQHWRHHNEEHAQSFRHWADEFRAHRLDEVAALLDQAFDLSQKINDALSEAAAQLKSQAE